MKGRVCCLWLMLDPTLMVPNFSSPQLEHLIWMGNMLCLVRLLKAWELFVLLSTSLLVKMIVLQLMLWLLIVVKFQKGEMMGHLTFLKMVIHFLTGQLILMKIPASSLGESIKGYGNEHFKKQDYKMALRKYRKALLYLDTCWEKEGIGEDKSLYLRKMKAQIFTNSSACKLKLGDLKGALVDADFAMRDGENNAKAVLFRQGQILIIVHGVRVSESTTRSRFYAFLRFSYGWGSHGYPRLEHS